MLRDEVTWAEAWSAERPTISLQNWGFEPIRQRRSSHVANNSFLPMYEISVKTLYTKAHGTSWLVNLLMYWEGDMPFVSPWGESMGALH